MKHCRPIRGTSGARRALQSLLVGLAVSILSVTNAVSGRAQDGVTPDVRDALTANAAALSPIQISWNASFSFPAPLPPEFSEMDTPDGLVVQQCAQRYLFQNQRIYALISFCKMTPSPAPSPLVTHVSELSFDGQSMFTGSGQAGVRPRGTATLMIETHQSLGDRGAHIFVVPHYLLYSGFWFPTRYDELGGAPQSLLLYLIDAGARVVRFDVEHADSGDVRVVELSAEHPLRHGSAAVWRFRFVLDGEKRDAVKQIEEFAPSGELALRAVNSDWRRLREDDVWLPQTVRIEHYSLEPKDEQQEQFHTRPVMIRTLRCAELSGEPVDEKQFVLVYDEPGAIVSDNRFPEAQSNPKGAIVYRVPADGTRLDEAVEAARAGKPLPIRSRATTMWIVLIANVALVIVFGSIIVWRRLR